jgi:hypothetical protein
VTRRPLCWGIYRELAHSPGRETDDALILRAAGGALERLGFEVVFKSPDELPDSSDASGIAPFLFVMCERIPTVERLAAWESHGIRIVNRPGAIRNTDRERTIARFREHGVAFPPTALVSTGGDLVPGAPEAPVWIKRADVHATQEGDVSFAGSRDALREALDRFAVRGMGRAVVQEHVPGDLIKFYGVAGEPDGEDLSWFQWFYHRDQKLQNHAFDAAALRALVARAARALGLEVFGGDAIAGPGRLVLIDLNAWPSFALFREEAASRIGAFLAARFREPVVSRP